jgi:hypothetical protein
MRYDGSVTSSALRNRTIGLVLGAIVAAAMACSSSYSSQPQGAAGGPCYPNRTCDPGLSCASNLCVVFDGGGDAGTNQGADAGVSSDDGGSPTADGGSSDDAGVVTCALMNGVYAVTEKASNAIDYDGGDCTDISGQLTWPADGGLLPQGTCAQSADGCKLVCKGASTVNGTTTSYDETFTIFSDSTGFTGVSLQRTTNVDGGALVTDCRYDVFATMQ